MLKYIVNARRPHRLAAQDGALSRLKQGFESPWGHNHPKTGWFFLLGAPAAVDQNAGTGYKTDE